VKWKEFWPFLGMYTDLGSLEGLTALEEFFKSKFCEELTCSGDAASPSKERLSDEQINPPFKLMCQPSPEQALKKTSNMQQQLLESPICRSEGKQHKERIDSEPGNLQIAIDKISIFTEIVFLCSLFLIVEDEPMEDYFTPPSSLPASGDEDELEPIEKGRMIFING
jgi:hypothetical protein